MTPLVPSYIAKLRRATKHLAELELQIAAYASTSPFEIGSAPEGPKHQVVHRLRYTRVVGDTDIPVILGDLIYNLRSALDHLAVALVERKRANSTAFPIFWRDVWEPPHPDDNEQAQRDRKRWSSYVRTMHPAAIEILKALQPPEQGFSGPAFDILQGINILRNRDSHKQGLVTNAGFRSGAKIHHLDSQGSPVSGWLDSHYLTGMIAEHLSPIHLAPGAVEPRINGTILIGLEMTPKRAHAPLPEAGHEMIQHVTDIIRRLVPYVQDK